MTTTDDDRSTDYRTIAVYVATVLMAGGLYSAIFFEVVQWLLTL